MKNPSKKQLREFGYLIGFGLPIILGWAIPSLLGHEFRVWTLWVAIPALIIAPTSPRLLKLPYKFWMFLGKVLGWINSRIILGIVYILVLQPISIIMKLLGHDPLNLRRKHKDSYRELKQNETTDFTRIF